jgi:glycosyltransferase involved in cell wall biosynthesis
MAKYNIIILNNQIMPYRIPLFEELSQLNLYNLTVLYCSQRATDRKWSLSNYTPNFNYKILHNLSIKLPKPSYQDEWRFIRFNPTLFLNLFRKHPHVIIAYEFSVPSIIALLYCMITGCKLVIWSEMTAHTDSQLSRGQELTRKIIIPRADGFIGTSYATCENFRRRAIDESRITLAPQTYVANQFKAIHPKNNHPPTIIYAGYLSERKGVDHLMSAFVKVIEQIPTAHLILIGEGHQTEQLQHTIRQENMVEHVTLTGFVEPTDLSRYYQKGDIFVFPTLEDTFGVVATEAIAAGLTLICSKYAGFSSHMTHGEHGYIVDPTNHEELTDYILRLLQSPDLRDTMNHNAQSILYQFKPPYVAQQFVQAIDNTLKSSS